MCKKQKTPTLLLYLNLSHIDDGSVLHISSDNAIIHLSDLIRSDELNVGDDIVLATKFQHLLRLLDAAN